MPQTFHFKAPVSGPKLLVLGAIHGDEVCGPRALGQIVNELQGGELKLVSGSVTLVPVCNQKAFLENRRYIDQNLNRIIRPHAEAKTVEEKLANELLPILRDCDYLLDLHSMQSRGEPFVFLNSQDAKSESLCRALQTQWMIEGWTELYEAHPNQAAHCTQSFADSLKIPNALIECGSHLSPDAEQVAYKSVLRALAHLGIIEKLSEQSWPPAKRLVMRDLYFREDASDRFAKDWATFDALRGGDLVGWRANGTEVKSVRDGYIIFPSTSGDVGTEWFYVAVARSSLKN